MAKRKADRTDKVAAGVPGEPVVPAPVETEETTAALSGHTADTDDAARVTSLSLVFEAAEADRLEAIRRSAEGLLKKIRGVQTPDAVWGYRDTVWPALGLPEYRDSGEWPVRLTLIPLSRIGQMEGKSGSLVLYGHFAFEDPDALCSHFLVVKTLSNAKPDKLTEEYVNSMSVKPFAYAAKDNFAIPIFFDDAQEGYKILWSICSATGSVPRTSPTPGTASSPFEVADLRTPLKENNNDLAATVISDTFDLLNPLHRRFDKAAREEAVVGEEYKRYLRGLGSEWGKAWEDVWGSAGDKLAADGRTVNPLWVVERLRPMKRPMYRGAIHGDLHAGNVILKKGGKPTIIDFGWAKEGAHVAKDFALLECNLRFLFLRTELRGEEVESFGKWVAWDVREDVPADMGSYLTARAGLIRGLRAKAAEVFPPDTDWDSEYVVPLFLVAVGLLRFASQFQNQMAAVRFVEATAAYLTTKLGL